MTRYIARVVEALSPHSAAEQKVLLNKCLTGVRVWPVPESPHSTFHPADTLWMLLQSDDLPSSIRESVEDVLGDSVAQFVLALSRIENRGGTMEHSSDSLLCALRIIQFANRPELKPFVRYAAGAVVSSRNEAMIQSDLAWEILAAYQGCGVVDDDLPIWELASRIEQFAALAFMSVVSIPDVNHTRRLFALYLRFSPSEAIDFRFLAKYLRRTRGDDVVKSQLRLLAKEFSWRSISEFVSLFSGLDLKELTLGELPYMISRKFPIGLSIPKATNTTHLVLRGISAAKSISIQSAKVRFPEELSPEGGPVKFPIRNGHQVANV